MSARPLGGLSLSGLPGPHPGSQSSPGNSAGLLHSYTSKQVICRLFSNVREVMESAYLSMMNGSGHTYTQSFWVTKSFETQEPIKEMIKGIIGGTKGKM